MSQDDERMTQAIPAGMILYRVFPRWVIVFTGMQTVGVLEQGRNYMQEKKMNQIDLQLIDIKSWDKFLNTFLLIIQNRTWEWFMIN